MTRLRPALIPDGHGNLRPDWSTPDEADIGLFLFAPASPQDELDGRQHGVRLAGRLYGGTEDADVKAGDRVRFADSTYPLVGAPERWRPGLVLTVERWDG